MAHACATLKQSWPPAASDHPGRKKNHRWWKHVVVKNISSIRHAGVSQFHSQALSSPGSLAIIEVVEPPIFFFRSCRLATGADRQRLQKQRESCTRRVST